MSVISVDYAFVSTSGLLRIRRKLKYNVISLGLKVHHRCHVLILLVVLSCQEESNLSLELVKFSLEDLELLFNLCCFCNSYFQIDSMG